MKRSIISAVLILLVPVLTSCDEPVRAGSAAQPFGSEAFERFVECKRSERTAAFIGRLFSAARPSKKDESYWSFPVSGEVMGLPVTVIDAGVCDIEGHRECGWASFIALTIDRPFEEARRLLQERYGVDFTEERRDEEYEVTLRPVLVRSREKGETVLYCDPGTL